MVGDIDHALADWSARVRAAYLATMHALHRLGAELDAAPGATPIDPTLPCTISTADFTPQSLVAIFAKEEDDKTLRARVIRVLHGAGQDGGRTSRTAIEICECVYGLTFSHTELDTVKAMLILLVRSKDVRRRGKSPQYQYSIAERHL
jgi:hypothetical protein